MMQFLRRFDPFGPVAFYTTPPEQPLTYDSYVNLSEAIAVHFSTIRGVKRAHIHLAHHQQPSPEVRDTLVLAQLRARLEHYARDDHWFQSNGIGTEQSTHFLNLNQIETIRFYRLETFPDELLAVVYAGNHDAVYELNRMNSTRDDLVRLEGLFRGEEVAPLQSEPPDQALQVPPPPPPATLPAEPPPVPALQRQGGAFSGRLPLPTR